VDLDSVRRQASRLSRWAGSSQFSIVHAIRVSDDGLVYVADRGKQAGARYSRSTASSSSSWSKVMCHLRGIWRSLRTLSQQFLYVGGGSEIDVLDRKSLEVVESIKGQDMLGGGHQMATDSRGNIYTAQTTPDSRSWGLKECRRHRADETLGLPILLRPRKA